MLPVSVIIPARNEASNIGRLLESLTTQDPPPGEILVIDAGSTDDTGKIARAYGATVIRVDRAYPGQARNIGAAHAHYDLLAFWDASMWVAPGTLAKLASPLLAEEADLVQGHLEIRPLTRTSTLTFLVLTPPYTHVLPTGPLYAHPVACTALHKAFWEKVGGFRPWRAREDSDFRKRVEAAGARVRFCPEALSYWEPAETLASLLLKVRLYGRHNLLSGAPMEWYSNLARIYGSYLLLSLLAGSWGGLSVGALTALGSISIGAFLRTLRKALRFGPYLKSKRLLHPFSSRTLAEAALLLLLTDWASFVGAGEWLLKDKLGLAPERFPEPVLQTAEL